MAMARRRLNIAEASGKRDIRLTVTLTHPLLAGYTRERAFVTRRHTVRT
jgi:hypothetical protein